MFLTCKTHFRGSGIHPSSEGVAKILRTESGKSPTVTMASNSIENAALGSARRVTADDLRVNVAN